MTIKLICLILIRLPTLMLDLMNMNAIIGKAPRKNPYKLVNSKKKC